MDIQSSLHQAEQATTKMRNAANLIQNAIQKPIVKANKTTVTVSTKAQEASDEAIKITQIFHDCFLETIENIRSVAEEFERTDEELQNSIQKLLQNQNMLRNIKTYRQAKKIGE